MSNVTKVLVRIVKELEVEALDITNYYIRGAKKEEFNKLYNKTLEKLKIEYYTDKFEDIIEMFSEEDRKKITNALLK